MLRYKSTISLSELQKNFSSDEKAIQTHFRVLLFPLFAVKDISRFAESSLYPLYQCGKDVFYRFLNNPLFDWRKLLFQITKQLISRAEKNTEIIDTENVSVRCLIADDQPVKS